ncbi:PepSY domain-containing protein [Cupriavidus sp. CV2]|uniref:PepSY domain-containing protein n=1 Tax=Cupriavidus ulmosensis TaxID=3065913 RepID=UPI00296A9A73|nr:PepSY domain-containing protein [Cupriavidus sp. CV2]MDW3688988.1 PepSY domain-containing protein [Cupriavidus sp. CV2]
MPDQANGERGEAARLASLAKIDATRAISAAQAKVPGAVLKVALDNENGNLVYSVKIKTASNEIKDVKVDAGNGAVLHVDAAGDEGEDED